MPSWTPNREDVRFDAALAAVAATECDEMAALLSTMASGMVGPASSARRDWTGRTRGDFEEGTGRIADEQRTTSSALTGLAEAIRAAAIAASAAQDSRVAQRARWQAEVDAERAASPPCRPGHPC